jgi:hypothetical protein
VIATSARPRFLVPIVLLALSGIGLVRHSHCHWRGHATAIVTLRELADQQYRAKEFAAAENTIRVAAGYARHDVATQLHVIASFYHQLGHSYPLAMVARPTSESFAQLEWAIEYDAMLGGAFTDELQRKRMHDLATVGPE